MKYLVEVRVMSIPSACAGFCFMKCDRVGKCQAKKR